MKTAFWSNVHGQTGTTGNAVAVANMDTLITKKKNAILQSHYELNTLVESMIGKAIDCYDIGIDELARSIKSAQLDERTIDNASISLMDRKLNLVLGTSKNNRELYHREMNDDFNRIVDDMQKYHRNVFIDTCSGNNELSASIRNNADLVVVNLSQNKQIINGYFDHYNIDQEKAIYLIGNYNCNSRYNVKNLIRMYPNFNRNNLAVIPYNVEFQDALCDGKAIDFMIKNFK